MGDKIKKIPQIRFKGFTDEWKQRKLGDYIIPYNEVTTHNNQYPVFTSSRKGLFFQTDYYDGNQIASEDNTGYNIVPRGYFTYRHMSDDLVFKFNINNLADNGIVSTLYPVFTTTENLDSKYLQYQLNEGEEFKRFAILQKQGGSRTYMYLSKLKDMTLTMPMIDEQIKIGKFFNEIDDAITLHQRKLELLKETKKGMLQKMFPKNGANVPEFRFSGFTDAWEKCNLGEMLEKYEDPVATPNDGYERLGIRSHAKGTFHSYVEPGKELETAKMQKVAANKFIVNITFGWEHAVAVTDENDVGKLVSHRFPQYSFKEQLDSSFFKYVMLDNKFKNHLLLSSPGGAGRNRVLKLDEMLKFEILLPNILEQKKIAQYFLNLDNLITLHQRELDLIKDLKKSLLQQMFI